MSDKLSIIKNIDADIINIDNNKSINYSSILNNNDYVDDSIAILDKYIYYYIFDSKVKYDYNQVHDYFWNRLTKNYNNGSTIAEKIIKHHSKNELYMTSITTFNMDTIYLKPFYNEIICFKVETNDTIIYYQKFILPDCFKEKKDEYLFIKDGYLKCILDKTYNNKMKIYIKLDIELPKIFHKIIGVLVIGQFLTGLKPCII